MGSETTSYKRRGGRKIENTVDKGEPPPQHYTQRVAHDAPLWWHGWYLLDSMLDAAAKAITPCGTPTASSAHRVPRVPRALPCSCAGGACHATPL